MKMTIATTISEFFDSGIVHGLNHIHPRNLVINRILWVRILTHLVNCAMLNEPTFEVCSDHHWFPCNWNLLEQFI